MYIRNLVREEREHHELSDKERREGGGERMEQLPSFAIRYAVKLDHIMTTENDTGAAQNQSLALGEELVRR